MEQRITMISLGVADLELSIEFYENKLRWKRSAMSQGDLIVFELNGIILGLYPRDELAKDANIDNAGSGFRGFAIAHNLSSIELVDDLFEELENKGVAVVKKPEKVFWGGYSGYVADPDGNLWEIAYNPFM